MSEFSSFPFELDRKQAHPHLLLTVRMYSTEVGCCTYVHGQTANTWSHVWIRNAEVQLILLQKWDNDPLRTEYVTYTEIQCKVELAKEN